MRALKRFFVTAVSGMAGATASDVGGFVGLKAVATPPLGLGLAALGRPGYITLGRTEELADAPTRTVEAMEARTHAVLDRAYDLGVRYFDCARSYGKAEEFMSHWLQNKGLGRDELAVGSKWGYRYTADWQIDTGGAPHEVKDLTVDHFLSQKEETLALLGPQLRLYQIHSATLESGVLDDAEVHAALRNFKEATQCRLGLSLSGTAQAETLRKAVELDLFDAVQATWNLFEQSAGEALLEAYLAGMEIIVKEALANGRVFRDARLTAAAESLGAAKDAVALAACMVQPFKPMVLSGAATVEQLESNVGALELLERCQADKSLLEVLKALQGDMEMDAETYWAERSALAWN